MMDTQQTRFAQVPSVGVVRMEGSDGLDLLQRISTNDLSKLQDHDYRHTILTTEKGKIVDVVTVWRKSPVDLLLISWSGQTSSVQSWIEKFIIMENCSVRNETAFCRFVEFGAEGRYLKAPAEWIWFDTSFGGGKFRTYVCPAGSEESVRKAFLGEGEQEASVEDFGDFCINIGLPQWPYEISPEVNPLEAGLGGLISWSKGCYIGQEVIARLDTYKKVQKHLIAVAMDRKPARLPAPILADGHIVGTLTRVTRDVPFVGLGYVETGCESRPLKVQSDELIALSKRS